MLRLQSQFHRSPIDEHQHPFCQKCIQQTLPTEILLHGRENLEERGSGSSHKEKKLNMLTGAVVILFYLSSLFLTRTLSLCEPEVRHFFVVFPKVCEHRRRRKNVTKHCESELQPRSQTLSDLNHHNSSQLPVTFVCLLLRWRYFKK